MNSKDVDLYQCQRQLPPCGMRFLYLTTSKGCLIFYLAVFQSLEQSSLEENIIMVILIKWCLLRTGQNDMMSFWSFWIVSFRFMFSYSLRYVCGPYCPFVLESLGFKKYIILAQWGGPFLYFHSRKQLSRSKASFSRMTAKQYKLVASSCQSSRHCYIAQDVNPIPFNCKLSWRKRVKTNSYGISIVHIYSKKQILGVIVNTSCSTMLKEFLWSPYNNSLNKQLSLLFANVASCVISHTNSTSTISLHCTNC